MKEVVIYVKGGMVQEVYASDSEIDVTVVDEDVPVEERSTAERPAHQVY